MTEEVEVWLTSIFVGQGYVQRAGSKRREGHCGRYHLYLTSEVHGRWDGIASACQDRKALASENGLFFLERGLARHAGLVAEAVMGKGCSKASETKWSESELCAFMLEGRGILKDESRMN